MDIIPTNTNISANTISTNTTSSNIAVKLLLATVTVQNGQLSIAGDNTRYQPLNHSGPFLNPTAGNLTPLTAGPVLTANSLTPALQQQLLQLLANGQALLPAILKEGNPTQLSVAGQTIQLPTKLPAGEWFIQRVGEQLRLLKAGDPVRLQPLNQRQLAPVVVNNGTLQIPGDSTKYQAPNHAGPFISPKAGVLTPLTLGPLLNLNSLSPHQQHQLIKQLASPQTLVPIQTAPGNLAQINVAGQSMLLAMNLPAGQWYVQRIAHQLRLLQAGDPLTLLPVTSRQSNTTVAAPPAAPVTQMMSLPQLASPNLIASLIKQIGLFPMQADLAGPMGMLVRQWLAQRDPSSTLSELVKGLHQYQQHSQIDADKSALYLALPYEHHGNQRRLQLSLKQYPNRKTEAKSNWLLRVQFELDLGVLQGNIRWQDQQASLELLCSTTSLTETAQLHLDGLRRRLHDNGVDLQQLDCRRAEISQDLRHLEQSYGR